METVLKRHGVETIVIFCQPYRLGAVIEGLISHYLSLLGKFFIWLQDHQTPSHIIKWYRFLSQIQPVSEDSEGAMCWCPKNPGFPHHCPVHSFAMAAMATPGLDELGESAGTHQDLGRPEVRPMLGQSGRNTYG